MDKISPEEKIQWMKKILQKKESISSVEIGRAHV